MKRYDLELTATGPVMEERKEGAFVPFSEVEQLQAKIFDLLKDRNGTGLAIDKAILSGIVPEQHPMRSRLELLANHHEREMELASQLSDATRQCGVMADLLREARTNVDQVRRWGRFDHDEGCGAEAALLLERIEAALAGKLPEPAMPEGWKLVEKVNCFTLVSDGQVIASMAGPTAENTASILAAVLSGQVPERRITKPARVWGARFMPGVAEQTVIDAAYRYAEHDASHEEKQAGKSNFDLLMAVVHKTVPEGWQLVPVKLTSEMLLSMKDAHWAIRGCQLCEQDYADIHAAMLAAAPKPEG